MGGHETMTIDLKHSFILQKQIKNAVRTASNQIISEIDKDQEINICKRSFELTDKKGKKYQVILEIKETD
jgi:hypothetical protein